MSTHNKDAREILQNTCRHNCERHEIGFPWQRDTVFLNSYFAALSQLRSLEKHFRENRRKSNLTKVCRRICRKKSFETSQNGTPAAPTTLVPSASTVGVLADIEGMFMQVAFREEDQYALRFLWLEDGIVHQHQ